MRLVGFGGVGVFVDGVGGVGWCGRRDWRDVMRDA